MVSSKNSPPVVLPLHEYYITFFVVFIILSCIFFSNLLNVGSCGADAPVFLGLRGAGWCVFGFVFLCEKKFFSFFLKKICAFFRQSVFFLLGCWSCKKRFGFEGAPPPVLVVMTKCGQPVADSLMTWILRMRSV